MCHQSVGLLQGAIEREGIPTVSVTLRPEITLHMKVSRAAYVRFPLGNSIGEACKPEAQRTILRALLGLLDTQDEDGLLVELPFRWRRM